MVSKVRTSQLNNFTQISNKDKGKIVITNTNNDKITTISPNKQTYKSMTLVKRIQKAKKMVTYV